jgi:hypothetical protein
MTLRHALDQIADRPLQTVIGGWHWKAAILSAGLRAVLFFAMNAGVSSSAGRKAATVEFLLRVPLVGALAAIGQTLSLVEPAWQAGLLASAALPLIAHLNEVLVHWLAGTPALAVSMLASLTMSCVATVFNQFAMRRNAFVVGVNGRPFCDDLRRLPGLCAAFLLAPFGLLSLCRRRGN